MNDIIPFKGKLAGGWKGRKVCSGYLAIIFSNKNLKWNLKVDRICVMRDPTSWVTLLYFNNLWKRISWGSEWIDLECSDSGQWHKISYFAITFIKDIWVNYQGKLRLYALCLFSSSPVRTASRSFPVPRFNSPCFPLLSRGKVCEESKKNIVPLRYLWSAQ